jgi:hypothetical protein
MAQPFTQLPGKSDRRIENAVPGIARGKRSLGWTASKKNLEAAHVLEMVSLIIGILYLASFAIALVELLGFLDLGGMAKTMAGPSFVSLASCTLLFGAADMLSGGRASLSGWIFMLVTPIALSMIMASMIG